MPSHHLNLFKFFNSNKIEYWEDNLSRAFAICLQKDPLFFQLVLQEICGNDWKELIHQPLPNYQVEIDVQIPMKEIDLFDTYFAVTSSGKSHDEEALRMASADSDQKAGRKR